ncbi:aspartate aminotransferase [Burkholderia oklahomensis EO147]|nr:aspartate aminotransferase [Burkholderia oklahomensis EO147]KUY65554.1 aspartate aminotransferase [Burkholderia oklahomensis EO147]
MPSRQPFRMFEKNRGSPVEPSAKMNSANAMLFRSVSRRMPA